MAEPAKDLTFLGLGELTGSRRRRLSFETLAAVLARGSLPLVDGSFADAEKLGDLGNGESVSESLDREESPPLQVGGRADGSHDR